MEKRVVHYINQFFAGVGGEDKAGQPPVLHEGRVGPALALNAALRGAAVTHTVVCGDNYIGSNTEAALEEILTLLEGLDFELFVAGPAFQAGRYGVACGAVCKAVAERFGVPVFTSMHGENPGVEMFRREMPVFVGGKSAASMRADMAAMAAYINKLVAGIQPGGAAGEGCFPRGVRRQVWRAGGATAARRGVDMLLKKLAGAPYETELPIPPREPAPIAPPVADIARARIALVNTGGIVPADNPDRIQSASATRWGRYNVAGLERLEPGTYKTIHAGYDPAAANADPNVVLPLDAAVALQREGRFGSLHPYFYSTVGTGTTQAEARRMAREMIPLLKQDRVDAIIMGSTWGTCTRCGATMAVEFEKAGIPVVQMCNLVPVALSVGSARIVPAISIPYPLGDPATPKETQWNLRKARVRAALDALAAPVEEQAVFEV